MNGVLSTKNLNSYIYYNKNDDGSITSHIEGPVISNEQAIYDFKIKKDIHEAYDSVKIILRGFSILNGEQKRFQKVINLNQVLDENNH